MGDGLLEDTAGLTPGIKTHKYVEGYWEVALHSVPKEMALPIYINGQEFVTILCTPIKLNYLVLGYLRAEGIIDDIEDIRVMRVCDEQGLVADVRIKKADFVVPQKRILTSGCGGGVSYNDSVAGLRIDSELRLADKFGIHS